MPALRLVKGDELHEAKKDYRNNIIEKKTDVLFTDFITMRIRKKQNRLAAKTITNHKALINYINAFAEQKDVVLYTDSIGEEFLGDFILFLEDKQLTQNYVKKILDDTKAFVAKAALLGFPIDTSYEDVTMNEEKTSHIYLTTTNINQLYFFDRLSRIQAQQRDLFIVGCWTGMRYSDYSTLSKEHFGQYIEKITQKTGIKVILPIHDHVREIFNKYNGQISRRTTVQNFDRMIKIICSKIGGKFQEPVTYTYTRGGKVITETKKRWELISSHTARRSFATNMYLTGRMKTYQIMACTGHTTEKSFFRYIGINNEEIVNQISSDIIFKE